MRIVVREQTLPAERQQTLETFDPLVHHGEIAFEIAIVDGIGIAQPALDHGAAHFRRHWQADACQPVQSLTPSSSSESDHRGSCGSQGSSAHSTVTPFGSVLANNSWVPTGGKWAQHIRENNVRHTP